MLTGERAGVACEVEVVRETELLKLSVTPQSRAELCVGALVVTPGFLAIAAGLHVAPAAAAVAAVVEEEPLAVGGPAFANGGASLRGKKLGSRLRDRPQYAIEQIASLGLPFPAIIAVPSRQFAVLQRRQRKVIDLLNVCGRGVLAYGDGGEGAIEAFAENDGFAEGASGSARVAARVGAQAGGQLRRQQLGLIRERHQVRIAVKVFGAALRKVAVAYGVGEIKAKRSAA
jgi:hypothetical protein